MGALIKEYKIVRNCHGQTLGERLDILQNEVNSHIRNGWVPYGDMTVSSNYLIQPMVLSNVRIVDKLPVPDDQVEISIDEYDSWNWYEWP